jgi:uncharacterized protein (DUF885 family)
MRQAAGAAMRRTARGIAWVGGSLVLLVAAFAMQTLLFRPWSIDWFFSRVHLEELLADPERASVQRRLPRWIDRSSRQLTDVSPAAEDAAYARARRQLRLLRGYDCSRLPLEPRTSCLVLEDSLMLRIEGERWRYHGYPLNQLFGVHNTLPAYLAGQHTIDDVGDADDYLLRLQALPLKFDGLLAGLAERERRALLPPRLLVDQVLADLRAQIAPPPSQHLLVSSLRRRLAQLPPEQLAEAERERLLAAAAAVVEAAVYPAYRRVIAHFEALLPQARADHGVWSLPDGDAYYAYLVRLHTSSALSPDQVHALGTREVARLHIELDRALRAVGLAEGNVGDRLAGLAARDEQRFAADRGGRVAILAGLRQLVAEAEGASRPWFERWPAATVRIEPVPGGGGSDSTEG